jgi:hypothetical protein
MVFILARLKKSTSIELDISPRERDEGGVNRLEEDRR